MYEAAKVDTNVGVTLALWYLKSLLDLKTRNRHFWHWYPMVNWVLSPPQAPHVLLRLEHFDEDWEAFCAMGEDVCPPSLKKGSDFDREIGRHLASSANSSALGASLKKALVENRDYLAAVMVLIEPDTQCLGVKREDLQGN
jgi:hypothetical protein